MIRSQCDWGRLRLGLLPARSQSEQTLGLRAALLTILRDMVEKFEILVPWIEGEGNVSDFLTKPLTSSTRFFKLRDEIINVRGQTAHVVCGVRFA